MPSLGKNSPPPPQPGKRFATGFAVAAFLLLLALFYVFVDRDMQQRRNPNRNLQPAGDGSLLLTAAADGHFRVDGTINGQPVVFLLDTGAGGVAVSRRLAEQLGLKQGGKVRVSTANGEVTAARTEIARLSFGNWQFHQVAAVILPDADDEVLLGMSVLHQLYWQQSQGRLRLSRYSDR